MFGSPRGPLWPRARTGAPPRRAPPPARARAIRRAMAGGAARRPAGEERSDGPELLARGIGVPRRGARLDPREPARRGARQGPQLPGAVQGRPPRLAPDAREEGLGRAPLAGGV